MSTMNYTFTSGDSDPLIDSSAHRLEVVETEAATAKAGQLTTWDAVREFIFAGHARFTLRSLKTGMRYTYQVKVKKQDLEAGKTGSDVTYFVALLRGPDNVSDYRYLGVLRKPGNFWTTKASTVKRDSASMIAMVWMLDRLKVDRTGVLGVTLEVWHEGKCGRCGRTLTVPESVASGIGPVCDGRAA